MKTKIISTRLTQLSIDKIKRYFNHINTRKLIETVILISENDNEFKQKILSKISPSN